MTSGQQHAAEIKNKVMASKLEKKKNTFISELLSFTGQKPSLWAKCGDDTSFYQSDACSDILLELK